VCECVSKYQTISLQTLTLTTTYNPSSSSTHSPTQTCTHRPIHRPLTETPVYLLTTQHYLHSGTSLASAKLTQFTDPRLPHGTLPYLTLPTYILPLRPPLRSAQTRPSSSLQASAQRTPIPNPLLYPCLGHLVPDSCMKSVMLTADRVADGGPGMCAGR
jgi:hypothetical protein